MEDATLYTVEVQIGGRIRKLVCNLDAAEEIYTEVKRNPFNPATLLTPDGTDWCPPGDIARIMAALIRESEPDVSAKALSKEMEMHRLPQYMEAIARVMAGPNFDRESPPEEANPLIANA